MPEETTETTETTAASTETTTETTDDKALSQADVDRIVGERLARERAKFADYEDLKTKAAQLDAIEEAKKDELQKAQERATELEQGKTEAEKRLERVAIRSAVLAEATRQGADPDAVLAILKDRGVVGGKEPKVTLGDDDQVAGVEEAVKALLEEKDNLIVGSRRPGPGDGGARHTAAPEGLTTVSDPAQVREMAKKLRRR